VIDRVYGRDNVDNAGDDLVSLLRQVTGKCGRYRFSLDTKHPNPWYHELVFEVDGLPNTASETLTERLAGLGLIEVRETVQTSLT